MPAAALHITFVDLCATRSLPAPYAAAIAARPRYARLGAMVHDLPYYGNMLVAAVRYGIDRPAPWNPWGKQVHSEGGAAPVFARLCARVAAPSPLDDEARRAFLAGVASHIALDTAMHDLVRFCARREMATAGDGTEDVYHNRAEKYQSLFFHLDLRGRDILGCREWLDRTRLSPGASMLWRRHEPALTDLWLGALADHYGRCPTIQEWTSWLRNFVHFGWLTCGYLARRNGRRTATDDRRRIYYSNDLFHVPDHIDAAARLTSRMVTLAKEYCAAGRFDDASRAKFVEDLALPQDLGWPQVAQAPLPYVVPPLPVHPADQRHSDRKPA
jgi:hypothetical protein